MGKLMRLGGIERRLLEFAKEEGWHDLDFSYNQLTYGSDKDSNIGVVIDLYCEAEPRSGINATHATYTDVTHATYRYEFNVVYAKDEAEMPLGYEVRFDGEWEAQKGYVPVHKEDEKFALELGELAARELFKFEYHMKSDLSH